MRSGISSGKKCPPSRASPPPDIPRKSRGHVRDRAAHRRTRGVPLRRIRLPKYPSRRAHRRRLHRAQPIRVAREAARAAPAMSTASTRLRNPCRRAPRVGRAHDVEQCEAEHAFRVIECQSIRHTAAAIVSGYAELREAQFFHDGHHIVRHRALRVGRVIGARSRTTALTVAAKVRAHDRKARGQQRRHLSPHAMGLREAMQ